MAVSLYSWEVSGGSSCIVTYLSAHLSGLGQKSGPQHLKLLLGLLLQLSSCLKQVPAWQIGPASLIAPPPPPPAQSWRSIGGKRPTWIPDRPAEFQPVLDLPMPYLSLFLGCLPWTSGTSTCMIYILVSISLIYIIYQYYYYYMSSG